MVSMTVVQSVRSSFIQYKMQARFLDRAFASAVDPPKLRFFMRAGAAVRLTARRLLKQAPKKRIADLSRIEAANYATAKKLYQQGRRRNTRSMKTSGRWIDRSALPQKPVLPDRVAEPGRPPYLHVDWDHGTSPLKHRLWFALTPDKERVVIGPAVIGRNIRVVKWGGTPSLARLEQHNPFMVPAFKIIEPKLPDYLQAAVR